MNFDILHDNVECVDSTLLCPLNQCILKHNTEALKCVLGERTKNPTPLQADSRGWTALHVAAFKDEHADCLKLLLSHKDALGLNLDAKTHTGKTALYLACSEGCINNCTILLEGQCNAEILRLGSGYTPLHISSLLGHAGIVSQLIAHGVNSNCPDSTNNTPLHLAALYGHLEVVRVLMKNKQTKANVLHSDEDPEVMRNVYGHTPLHVASMYGRACIVSELIAHGFNPNCLNCKNYNTSLHYASKRGMLNVVRVLLTSKQTKVNIRNRAGDLPLHKACARGYLEIVRILLEADCSLVNSCNKQAYTPLMRAIQSRDDECVKYLLDQGADANQCRSRQETILYDAALSGIQKILELVLQASRIQYIHKQFMLHMTLFLSTRQRELRSLISPVIDSASTECLTLLLESDIPKGILEISYMYHHPIYKDCDVYTPIAYLFYAANVNNQLFIGDRDKFDKLLRLLLEHKITHLYKFSEMVELKASRTVTINHVHPYTYIFRGPWLPVERDHYLNTLFEYGITTDYCLQCDVHYNSRFRDIDLNVLKHFYKPVVRAIIQDKAEFVELLLVNSAILEPSHLWNCLQYQHQRLVAMERESPRNVVNYLIDLGVIDVNTSNLPSYPFGGIIKCPNLQQLCRQAIRKHLRDETIQDNLKNFKEKINALPLPNLLKYYLNFKRR